jgi:hypothetical protein
MSISHSSRPQDADGPHVPEGPIADGGDSTPDTIVLLHGL